MRSEAVLRPIRPFHHYSAAIVGARDPIEALEEEVVDMLLGTRIGDDRRDSSIRFELKHSAAVTQFSRLLARARGLPIDVCAAGGLLHDIHVVATGSYADHAHLGAPVARAMAENVGGFSELEIQQIETIVWNHSDKHVVSDDPFAEFGKDADVLDAFLYPGAFDWYLANKPLATFRHYLSRATAIWNDLGIPPDPGFALLQDHGEGWLDGTLELGEPTSTDGLSPVEFASLPPFMVVKTDDGWCARFCTASWERSSLVLLERAAASVERDPQSLGAMVWPAIQRIELLQNDPAGERRRDEIIS